MSAVLYGLLIGWNSAQNVSGYAGPSTNEIASDLSGSREEQYELWSNLVDAEQYWLRTFLRRTICWNEQETDRDFPDKPTTISVLEELVALEDLVYLIPEPDKNCETDTLEPEYFLFRDAVNLIRIDRKKQFIVSELRSFVFLWLGPTLAILILGVDLHRNLIQKRSFLASKIDPHTAT